jgi:hypothetical protein
VRGPHFEKSLPACIVAAQERAEEKIKGKIEAFWWDSAFFDQKSIKKCIQTGPKLDVIAHTTINLGGKEAHCLGPCNHERCRHCNLLLYTI